jgi:hypothetical protein
VTILRCPGISSHYSGQRLVQRCDSGHSVVTLEYHHGIMNKDLQKDRRKECDDQINIEREYPIWET